jgi:hypothetical protein
VGGQIYFGKDVKSSIVLDKSFLQGATMARMRELAASHRLLMSDALFYEMLSNPETRRSCFVKFPAVENPVDVVLHVGGYLKTEIQRRKPAPRPSQRIERSRFVFNVALLDDDYELPAEGKQVMAEQEAELARSIAFLREIALQMPDFFPDAFAGSGSAFAFRAAEAAVTTDAEALIEFYGTLRSPKGHRRLPPKRLLTPEWALFRWLQVHFLFALDLFRRYGLRLAGEITPELHKKVVNDALDAQLLLIGALEGSFATREAKLQRWFSAMCPEGSLFT